MRRTPGTTATERLRPRRQPRAQDPSKDTSLPYLPHVLTSAQSTALATKLVTTPETHPDYAPTLKTLVTGCLRFVALIASRIQLRNAMNTTLNDRFQTGTIGLIQAATNKQFDQSKGRFTTYAGYYIRHAIYRDWQNTSALIRTPTHAGPPDHHTVTLDNEAAEQLHQGDHRDDVITALTINNLHNALKTLSEKEQHIVTRHLRGERLDDLGEHYGVTGERIRQIEATARTKLNRKMTQKPHPTRKTAT